MLRHRANELVLTKRYLLPISPRVSQTDTRGVPQAGPVVQRIRLTDGFRYGRQRSKQAGLGSGALSGLFAEDREKTDKRLGWVTSYPEVALVISSRNFPIGDVAGLGCV
jgi:hypothetical protein